MPLHRREDRDNGALGQWWKFLVIFPPFDERPIRVYEEALFRWRGFGEGVRDVGTVDKEVFGGRDSVEQSRTCLVYAVGVCLVQNPCLTCARRAVTDASSLLSAVECFDVVRPDEVEDAIPVCGYVGITKHALVVVLIQL